MYLKRLELSGFKSFARTTVLEFPSRVTAVVGPNGSGKSNIKEAIQWVLGEQSMKSLRGRRGEDLIWNGSPSTGSGQGRGGAPRMGKAAVSLSFDNHKKILPIEFDEVVLTRKIFRDGVNEYLVNGSPARLRDVHELAARMGLGEQKHNIIGQGEVDRLLLVSARERRTMLEEALGLRVYQLKRAEAERKLAATDENMRRVEGLMRELAPHIKFLRLQAQKAETRERLMFDLSERERAYWMRELHEIGEEKRRIAHTRDPLEKKRAELRKEIRRLLDAAADAEKMFELGAGGGADNSRMAALAERRRVLDRDLGRLEGRLEAERAVMTEQRVRPADVAYAKERIRVLVGEIRAILNAPARLDANRGRLENLVRDFERLVDEMERGFASADEEDRSALRELASEIASLQKEVSEITKELERYEKARLAEEETYRQARVRARDQESLLRAKQEEERDLAIQAERVRFEAERILERERAARDEMKSAGVREEDLASVALSPSAEGESAGDLRRKIERLRGKLEEVGGIDQSIIREYRASEERHAFLAHELEDVKRAGASLRELMGDLDERMQSDFKKGFAKINDSFHQYFKIIFGGGRAALRIVEQEARSKGEEMTEEEGLPAEAGGAVEAGIEIEVDLPRKRIRGLTMLSGGERALTAIALLFAITAVNPPPFLVLDETDAALDEANSQRYAAILKELAKHTQLIVITHNRETMKAAGVLYGITMREDGVSRLLSLKLEQAEEYTDV